MHGCERVVSGGDIGEVKDGRFMRDIVQARCEKENAGFVS